MVADRDDRIALIVPGLDSIFSSRAIAGALRVPQVRESLRAVALSPALSARNTSADPALLETFLAQNRRPHVRDFNLTLVAMFGLQVGLIRALEQVARWDWVVGCSHGDFARGVVAGVLSLHDAVDIIWAFGTERTNAHYGLTANLRRWDKAPLHDNDVEWVRGRGGAVTFWSPAHATVSGTAAVIEGIEAEARAQGLKVTPVLAYPVHSSAMQPVVDRMVAQRARWQVNAPNQPVFSSVLVRPISQPDEFVEETVHGTLSPVRWLDTVAELRRRGVRTFINVGPGSSLVDWLSNEVDVRHAGVLLGDAAPSEPAD